jgi:uncharacterized protein
MFKRIEMMTPRIFKILLIHQRLDGELRREQTRRWPDVPRIQRLKKMKLRVKDLLHSLSAAPRKHANG